MMIFPLKYHFYLLEAFNAQILISVLFASKLTALYKANSTQVRKGPYVSFQLMTALSVQVHTTRTSLESFF